MLLYVTRAVLSTFISKKNPTESQRQSIRFTGNFEQKQIHCGCKTKGAAKQGSSNSSGLSLERPSNKEYPQGREEQMLALGYLSVVESLGYLRGFVVVQFVVVLFDTGSHYAVWLAWSSLYRPGWLKLPEIHLPLLKCLNSFWYLYKHLETNATEIKAGVFYDFSKDPHLGNI